MPRKVPLATPGEILLHDFLEPMGIRQYRLAKEIGVPQRRIGEIVAGPRAITADTALRLAAFFGTDAQSWINLQSHYDMPSRGRAREPAFWRLSRTIAATPAEPSMRCVLPMACTRFACLPEERRKGGIKTDQTDARLIVQRLKRARIDCESGGTS